MGFLAGSLCVFVMVPVTRSRDVVVGQFAAFSLNQSRCFPTTQEATNEIPLPLLC